jgi:hypothetical protein
MDINSIQQPQQEKAAKESPSLLSQVSLHFEYNKTIPQVRASLNSHKR